MNEIGTRKLEAPPDCEDAKIIQIVRTRRMNKSAKRKGVLPFYCKSEQVHFLR